MQRLKDYWNEDDQTRKRREAVAARERQVGIIIMLGLFTLFPVVMLACNDDGGTVVTERASTPSRPTFESPAPVVVPASERVAVVTVEPESRIPVNPTFADGEEAFRDRRYEDALEIFSIWTGEHPANVWGHYMAGLSALRAGRFEDAEDSFAAALVEDPTHVKSLRNVARLYLETDRPAEALQDIEFAIELDPESGENYRLLALAQTDLGLTLDAIDSYRHALTLDSTDAWSMNNLGLLYIRDERFGMALGPLARATQLRDDVSVFFNNLGVALERNGYLSDAADSFRRAVELDDNHQLAHASLVRVESREAVEVYVADLEELAHSFSSEMEGWREPVASEQLLAIPTSELTTVEFEETVSTPTQPEEGTEEFPQIPPEELDYESISVILQLP